MSPRIQEPFKTYLSEGFCLGVQILLRVEDSELIGNCQGAGFQATESEQDFTPSSKESDQVTACQGTLE